nr:PAS domain-containing protein [Archangium sp.]
MERLSEHAASPVAAAPAGAVPPLWIGAGDQVRLCWVSPALVALLGYPSADWMDEGFLRRLVPPEDFGTLREAWHHVVEHREKRTVELRVRSEDAHLVPVSVELNAFSIGTQAPGGVLGVVRRLPVLGDEGPSCRCPMGRMEQELTQAQRKHEELVDTLDGIVWEGGPDLRFSFVSKQAERLLGYPLQRWLQEPDFWLEHLHPEDRAWVPPFCQKKTEACSPHQFEYRMIAADGRTVWLRDLVTVLADEHGHALKSRGIMVDVTEQHRTREHLERTVSILRATLDSTTDGVLVVDRGRRISAFNEKFQSLWRLPPEMLTSRRDELALAHALGQACQPERFLDQLLAMYENPEAEGFDVVELRDGRIIEWYSRPQRVGDTIVGRVWSFRDMTQRVRMEQERDRLLVAELAVRERMEESLALLDTFLNNAPIGLGFLDRDLRYLRINDALAALQGRTREENLGRTLHEALPHMASSIEPLLRRVLETGEPLIDHELRGETPSHPGQQRHWRVSYYPVRTSNAGLVGVGAVVVEVTAERRAQEERERLLREAQEAIRVRDDFLSIASHELKTPLTPLTLHLQMLKKRSACGQPLPEAFLEKALAQVGRLSGLINDLLDASRIQTGRLELECGRHSLRELVRESLDLFQPLSARHPFQYEEPEEKLLIQGDRSRLAQVMTNLLENALKYSPTGGTIRVAVERKGAEARVSVSDSGIGIPKDQQAHLFERFFRARNAPISGFGGLGLGLYICRDIIERHGGRIGVESEVGRGSTFHFTLPLASGSLRP